MCSALAPRVKACGTYTKAVWGLAAIWLLVALVCTRGVDALTPDSTQYAITARSLLEGEGFTIDFVRFHLGLRDSVRHVPETHGLLRPLLLVPLFAAFGLDASLVRIPGLFYVSATALLAFYFGRRVFGPATGLFAAAVVLTSRPFFFEGVAGNDDPGFACFFLASLLALHVALGSGRLLHFGLAGALGAVALLEKLEGVIWPVLALAPLLLARAETRRVFLRGTLVACGAFGVGVATVLVRNAFASGGVTFRSLDWLWKITPPAERGEMLAAIYDSPPGMLDVLREIGWHRTMDLVLEQFNVLASELIRWGPLVQGEDRLLTVPGFLAGVGLVGLVLHLRRHPAFAALGLATCAGAVALLCGPHHVEQRFLLFLVPILALSAGGVVEDALRGLARRGAERSARRLALGLAAAWLVANAPFATFLLGFASRPPYPQPECYEAVRARVPDTGRILAFRPERVAWETGREAVLMPSGGRDAIWTVAKHYRAEWLLAQPAHPKRHASAFAAHKIADSVDPGGAVEEVSRPDCRLVRLSDSPPSSVSTSR